MKSKNLLKVLTERYPALAVCEKEIVDAAGMIIHCYTKGGKLLICGNGGSSSDSEHFAAELMKSFEIPRPLDPSLRKRLAEIDPVRGKILGEKLGHSLPAISLSSNEALATAIANDMGADYIFAQQLLGFADTNDLLVAISTSGNSSNVIDACITARALKLGIIGLTGKKAGYMNRFCDCIIAVPATETADIQELQLPVMHTICRMVENHFFAK
jgi:D-sedoheptulose 7-phosphate isomerase